MPLIQSRLPCEMLYATRSNLSRLDWSREEASLPEERLEHHEHVRWWSRADWQLPPIGNECEDRNCISQVLSPA